MTTYVLVPLICYTIIALCCWSAGVNGIAVTMIDRTAQAQTVYVDAPYAARQYVRNGVLRDASITLFVGALWPVGIPLYLAWHTGRMGDAATADPPSDPPVQRTGL